MAKNYEYTLIDVLDRLGVQYRDHGNGRGKMPCFICKGKRSEINLSFEDNCWHCYKCGSRGGVLAMFQRYQNDSDMPESKDERIKVSKELQSFMEGSTPSAGARPRRDPVPHPVREAVPVASDQHLNAVYSAMLDLPLLQLLPAHRENLRNRGLSETEIEKNGYRSIPADKDMRHDPMFIQMYETAGGNRLKKRICHYKTSADQVIFGLAIASYLHEHLGLDLKGVPGFFKFGVHWCYFVVPGILIPTRNISGHIVIFQVRKDRITHAKEQRYITMSNASLPGHVTGKVSRTHFPLSNAPLSATTKVLITEGPLKADTACFLHETNVAFVAIPGIKSTEDLYNNVLPQLMQHGVSTIGNAFDMDRLQNNNVRKGSLELEQTLTQKGFRVVRIFWGKEYAVSQLLYMQHIAKKRNVAYKLPQTRNVFEQLDAVALALYEADINVWKIRDAKGNEKECYWDPKTKGIDDYLNNK